MFHGNKLAGPQRAVNLRLPLRTGADIPVLGFGTYRLAPDVAADAVDYAIECGFRHIDCAKIYRNEKQVGEGIRRAMKRLRIPREQLFVTSKLWPTDQAPEHVSKACAQSVQDLGLDYLDLYLAHWPVAWRHTGKWESDDDFHPKLANGNADVNKDVTLTQTWAAMEALVDAKLTRHLGLSNSTMAELNTLSEAKWRIPAVTNQVECHPGLQQHILRSAMSRDGILMSCYCPLGMPTRFTPPDFQGIANHIYFSKVAELTGFSPQRLLLNWAVDNCNIVLVKSANKKHIADNAKVSTGMLSDAQRKLIQGFETINGAVRVINPTDFRDDGTPFFQPPAPRGPAP